MTPCACSCWYNVTSTSIDPPGSAVQFPGSAPPEGIAGPVRRQRRGGELSQPAVGLLVRRRAALSDNALRMATGCPQERAPRLSYPQACDRVPQGTPQAATVEGPAASGCRAS